LALMGAPAGCVFSPACWDRSSAAQAVPLMMGVGAVACTGVWKRGRRGWRGVRDRPSARARRAVGSPLATPRRRNPRVAGLCRVLAKTGPVSRVS
jgi:hypothetical protein